MAQHLREQLLSRAARGRRQHRKGAVIVLMAIFLVVMISLLALAIDRILYWIQRELFPYKYESAGILHWCVRLVLRGWEDFKGPFFGPPDSVAFDLQEQSTTPESRSESG